MLTWLLAAASAGLGMVAFIVGSISGSRPPAVPQRPKAR